VRRLNRTAAFVAPTASRFDNFDGICRRVQHDVYFFCIPVSLLCVLYTVKLAHVEGSVDENFNSTHWHNKKKAVMSSRFGLDSSVSGESEGAGAGAGLQRTPEV
jgi:hypothetical protein